MSTGTSVHPEVLLVEDEDDEIWILGHALQRHRMEARFKIVRSGEEALGYLRTSTSRRDGDPPRPKLIVLDLKLGGISGHAVLREIRANPDLRRIPVVILSSSMSDADLCECYECGANSFVPKQPGRTPAGEHVVEIARYWLELNRPAP